VRGNSYHSRVSWSLLEACGVGELAADDDENYVSLAVHLAENPDALRTIRMRLEENRRTSPVFDPQRMARHLERAFEIMADRARQGLPADHIDVPPLAG
jgi:predicted O-linked N-acetylglucosamine transferase (SPINDLY family)